MDPLVKRCLVNAKQQELAQLTQLYVFTELVTQIGDLVHQIQRERGISNQLLYTPITGGSELLKTQQEVVEKTFSTVESKVLQLLQDDHMLPARIQTALAYALYAHHGLVEVRHQVLADHALQLCSGAPSEQYTQRIRYWLDVVIEVAALSVTPELSVSLLQLIYLLQAKEFAGQERAMGVIALSGKSDSNELAERLAVLQCAQQDNIKALMRLVPSNVVKQYTPSFSEIPSHEFLELRRLIAGLCQHKQASPALAQLWFDVASSRIDVMHHLMVQLLRQLTISVSELQQRCDHARQQLKRQQEVLHLPSSGSFVAPDYADTPSLVLLWQFREQAQYIAVIEQQLCDSKAALEELKVVQRAKLLLMERYRVSEAQAHHKLQKLAMDQQQTLGSIANSLVQQLVSVK